MRGYRGLWHSLKTNYRIMLQRDIVMNILKEIDPEGTNMQKTCCLRRKRYVSEGTNSSFLFFVLYYLVIVFIFVCFVFHLALISHIIIYYFLYYFYKAKMK